MTKKFKISKFCEDLGGANVAPGGPSAITTTSNIASQNIGTPLLKKKSVKEDFADTCPHFSNSGNNWGAAEKSATALSEDFSGAGSINQMNYELLSGPMIDGDGVNALNGWAVADHSNTDGIDGVAPVGSLDAADALGHSIRGDDSPTLASTSIPAETMMKRNIKESTSEFDNFLNSSQPAVVLFGREIPFSTVAKSLDTEGYVQQEKEFNRTIGKSDQFEKNYSHESDILESKSMEKTELLELLDKIEELMFDFREKIEGGEQDVTDDLGEDLNSDLSTSSSDVSSSGESAPLTTTESQKQKKLNSMLSEKLIPVLQGGFYRVMKDGKQVGFGVAGKPKDGKVIVGGKPFDIGSNEFISMHIGQ